MADLAMVFHWAPGDMHDMTLTELAEWRQAAIARMPRPERHKRR